jgi:hypothetical protein
MANKQTQPLKRLIKKLSALRMVLRKDERSLLDQLILGESASELAGYRLGRKGVKAAEVVAHHLDSNAAQVAAAVCSVHSMLGFDAGTGRYIVKEEESGFKRPPLKEGANSKVV